MNIKKAFSHRSLLWALIMILLFTAIIDVGIWLVVRYLSMILPLSVLNDAASHASALSAGLTKIMPVAAMVRRLFIPITAGIAIIFSLALWLILRGSFSRLMQKSGLADAMAKDQPVPSARPASDGADAAARKKELQEQNRRYYLNLLSVLQREGRLVDFFQEDLGLYADEQIGAAVRSIHENCHKTIQKYLSPKSVIDKDEGETVTVMPDFDPGAVKLIGNVTGEPPFKGVLRHRGWRATKIELPVLSAAQDAAIIAPAEVEIQ